MSVSHDRVPELVPETDICALPLSALEGFVLSRVDGKSSVGDLVSVTNLPPEQVVAIVQKLLQLSAIRLRDVRSASAPAGAASSRPRGASPASSYPAGRRRSSHSLPPQRRMWSESSIAAPPPDMRSYAPRARHDSQRPQSRAPAVRETPAPRATPPPASEGPQPRASTPKPPGGSASFVSQPLFTAPRPEVSLRPPAPEPAGDVPSQMPASAAPAAARPLYDPRELDEDVELPRDRRKQVLDLYYRLPEINYYEALGVPYSADRKDIRRVYFGLSKVFHPDSMFRKRLGSFKAKMEAVFQFLTEGYEILSKKGSREEYDAYLRATQATKLGERVLADGLDPAAGVEQVPPPPRVPAEANSAPPSSMPVPDVPVKRGTASPEARKLAQTVISRRLKGAASQLAPPPEPAAKSSQPPRQSGAPPTDTRELLRRLTRTLKDVGHHTGSHDAAARFQRAARLAEARGDLPEAVRVISRAISVAPERPDLREEHVRLSRLAAEKLANDYEAQAKFESKQGKWASAALSWVKVCEGRPHDAHAHRAAAQALLKAGGDLRGAQRYAQKAAFLLPRDAETRVLLAQIYMTLGLGLNARRELDAATKLDPESEIVKNLMSELKG